MLDPVVCRARRNRTPESRRPAIIRRTLMKRTTNLVIALLFSSVLLAAAQQATTPQAQPSMGPPSKAANPAPSTSAQGKTQKNSIGTGSLSVTTAQPVVFWQEQVAGSTVPTNFLYDSGAGI